MKDRQSLADLIADAEKLGDEVSAKFGHLSASQLNWKRSAEEWSIGQCFEHLLMTNRPYFPLIEKITAGEQRRSLWERMPVLPGVFGNLVLGAVSPESTRKIKARPGFQPAQSAVNAEVIKEFTLHQRELVRLMKSTEGLPIERIIITSPVASFVTYSLLDGYRIVVTHERRHSHQAERVMAAEEFPRA